MRAGGGVIDLPRADNPLVFANPVALSFGLVAPTATQTQQVDLTDAGGGAGTWAVSLTPQSAPSVDSRLGLADRDRARAAPGHRDDDEGARCGGDGLRRPHPRRREAPHPLLVPDRRRQARERKDDTVAARGLVLVDDQGRRRTDHELQLPAVAFRLRVLGEAARSGACLPPDARPSRHELRRRRHEPRQGRPGRAEDLSRGRRAPADRLRPRCRST